MMNPDNPMHLNIVARCSGTDRCSHEGGSCIGHALQEYSVFVAKFISTPQAHSFAVAQRSMDAGFPPLQGMC
jgi:hypothetical protein